LIGKKRRSSGQNKQCQACFVALIFMTNDVRRSHSHAPRPVVNNHLISLYFNLPNRLNYDFKDSMTTMFEPGFSGFKDYIV